MIGKKNISFVKAGNGQAAGDEGITAFGGGFVGIGNGFTVCGSGVAVFWIAFRVASPSISAAP
jgi:hypothetical protein